MVSTDNPQSPTTAPDVDEPDEADASWRRFLPATAKGWVASVAAMLYLAGALGYMVGIRSEARPGADSVDVGFLQDMISHHEQGIEMANIELVGGAVPDVEAFAREILAFQAYEVGVMEGQLAEWGRNPDQRGETAMAWMDQPVPVEGMPGLASEDEMRTLARAEGRDVDALFVPLMQDHHRGGIHMAEYAADAASDPAVRALAARMARNQRIEVEELDAARVRADLPAAPPGYVPAEMPADPGEPTEQSGHDH